ncbi:hypothetical protein TIFTF001_023845 [Ficus carica]|uniref:Uncharacterized protein n=1 Tax=Ficus carica TaxID=3494 RepID=A0AA88AKA9_FICCA|nr:hypothetical protein TIFTF001_023845 [Ficus carica]
MFGQKYIFDTYRDLHLSGKCGNWWWCLWVSGQFAYVRASLCEALLDQWSRLVGTRIPVVDTVRVRLALAQSAGSVAGLLIWWLARLRCMKLVRWIDGLAHSVGWVGGNSGKCTANWWNQWLSW